MDEPGGTSRLVTAGTVGRPHGLDGSFRVIRPFHDLVVGTAVQVGDTRRDVVARRGSDDSPIVRLEGVGDREAAAALRGQLMLVDETVAPFDEGEWLASDLIGCEVEGLGRVEGVLDGPSCDVLELTDGVLVPLVADAIATIDLAARRIDVHRAFLGLDEGGR